MVCVQPVGHKGRCRDRKGRTWENNHPKTEREQQALLIAERAVRERDEAYEQLDKIRAALDTIDQFLRPAIETSQPTLFGDPT